MILNRTLEKTFENENKPRGKMKNSIPCEKKKRNSIEKIKHSSKETLLKKKKSTISKKKTTALKKTNFDNKKSRLFPHPNPYLFERKLGKHNEKQHFLKKKLWKENQTLKKNLSLEKLLKENPKL